MAQARKVLDLDTLAPTRPTVKIKTKDDRRGKHYEIKGADDLSLSIRAELGRLGRKMEELQPRVDAQFSGEDDTDESVIEEFEQIISEFLRYIIIDLPKTIIVCLRLEQKQALLDAFTEASPNLKGLIEEAVTSENPSQGSKSSTVARPKAGSTSVQQS